MHLKQLKIAGFKSFVDPTIVPFPSQLVGVVGPNGCGKSNVIDAVRWVMGESSAKNLRGESMTDVIFNGSTSRKPLGQASVELVFDNSLGRIAGPFSSYSELAVKRVVTRDGESSYYLNGSRCRRKDITDLFLGTGAGSRSYSIIGQGTISRLIEAKPEELRAFLEEAAGVSKYKERRRETLQRIEHTRENLTRVADIREELNKHLQRLERQAKAAERYTQLVQEEKRCRAEILALKWQDQTEKQSTKQRELLELRVSLEQQQSILTNGTMEKTLLNEQLQDATQHNQIIQESLYQIGMEMARLEEGLLQREKEKKRLEQEREQMLNDSKASNTQLQQDKDALINCQQLSEQLKEQLLLLQNAYSEKEVQWNAKQAAQKEWEAHWTETQAKHNAQKQQQQLTKLKLQHLDERRNHIHISLEKLDTDSLSVSLLELEQRAAVLKLKQEELQRAQQSALEQVNQANEGQLGLRNQLKDTEKQVSSLQDDYHRLSSELAALKAAQKAARRGTQAEKAENEGWAEKARLMDVLHVEPTWQAVCEMILGDDVRAYVVENINELWSKFSENKTLTENVVSLKPHTAASSTRPKLGDKVQGLLPVTVNSFEHIYAAENREQALSWCPDLLPYESVVTPDGYWLGNGWARLAQKIEVDEIGILARQQKINEMSQQVAELEIKLNSVRQLRDEFQTQIQDNLIHIEQLQTQFNLSNEELRNHLSTLNDNSQQINHTEKRIESMAAEKLELTEALEEISIELSQTSAQLIQLDKQTNDMEVQYQQLLREKQFKLDELSEQSQQLNNLRNQLHQVERDHDREMARIQQLVDRVNREQERLQKIQLRLEELEKLYLTTAEPENELKKQLELLLAKHGETEEQLNLSRDKVSHLKMKMEELDLQLIQHNNELKKLQELISQVQMEEQALAVRASSFIETMDETGYKLKEVLEGIPAGFTQTMKEDELITVSEKISRLGAINLAAIEEFASEKQRQVYLDEQYHDLNQALTTLESAIEKMDNETKSRLESTFDEVNTSFKALFPRLFGGGRAQLELTCDNLLEAGIVVMAQPPGKRNSTIHLLSGGEKAMTAVALVFAIFQLNPSPFCMLDEVDAPLDDLNVSRFCDLVKEMSQFVQFLFITHNKVTMELADHLIGVTMREPGVSRLVAVDVKQALTME
ncbi:chromosome segregation protein SMC [Legionella waltersii]|uniref:Chromosome partition protein Smc n=1 Tax=Legionella waltersii TaxID=66969 RepID=A0A0W1AD16_9GAMM|nr:chromosome segregation protein SMC [Legionella waltersii]KTD79209.1 chromosome segregation SMC protein [Legionella waltersii]SNV12526.1 chromosome segregation protein SMC [Legionella waltersii]